MMLQINETTEITKNATKVLIESGILGALLVLALVVIGIIVWHNNKKNISLQEKVDKVTAQHIETIKESSKDSQVMVDKYHAFVNEIKELFHNHHK